jgi:hypothetical protein
MAGTKSKPTRREAQIPALAKAGTAAAHRRALRVGSVVIYKDGELRRIEAGGKSTVIKNIGPQMRVKKGTRLLLKSPKS